jgi:hypothetical protein
MPVGAIGAGVSGIGSILGSIFGGPKQSQTSTSTTKGNYDPSQVNLLQNLWAQYQKALGMGTAPQQSDVNAMATGVNNAYAGVKTGVESDLTSRGYASSGKLGKGFRQVDEARVGAQQQGMQSLNSQALQRYLSLIGMGQGVAGAPLGGTTTTSTGNATQSPGFGSQLGPIGGDIGTMLMLSKLMPGGGFFGGGSGGGAPITDPAFPPP